MKRSSDCLYCGKVGPPTKEHVVPKALGGTRQIKCVCSTCNNRTLSELDDELATKSPLSLVIGAELLKKSRYTWDVDHSDGNLLLEAKADVSAGNMIVWPQIIFDDAKLQMRGDAEELRGFGPENFENVFVRHMLMAFQTMRTAQKRPRLVFETVPDKIPPMYRCPPRVFATRSIRDFDHRMHFQCRYRTAKDRRRVLHALETWDSGKRFGGVATQLGSTLPTFHLHYEAVAVIRSLTKISLNLLRFLCTDTPIDREHFKEAIELVLGEHPVARGFLARNGFVDADTIRPLECAKDSHHIRLIHDRGWWTAHFAFCGGRVGASVHFRGPNHETWRTADIIARIGCSEWDVSTTRLLLPLTTRIAWQELSRVIPSLPLANVRSTMTDTP